MFKSKSYHRNLIKGGAPKIPPGYFYYPTVGLGDPRWLRMEIRKSTGWFSSVSVAAYTVDPEGYFTGDEDNIRRQVHKLCENAARRCDDFVVEHI